MRSKRNSLFVIVSVLTCLLSVGAIPCTGMAERVGERGEREESRTVALYERLAPATVSLLTIFPPNNEQPGAKPVGMGAGFIVDEQGTVVTNAHVVEGAVKISASLFNGAQVEAELLAIDSVTDVAILRLPEGGGDIVPATLGDSDRVRVGHTTLVVGSPFGLGFTLTNGIISGFQPAIDGREAPSSRLIQTTAAINPGNSGGPLVDSQGRVIGMSKATVLGAQNIAFAIPINVVKQVLEEYREKGRIARPWLGIAGKFVTEDLQRLFALPLVSGLLVEHIDDPSPAAEAGVRSGTLNVSIENIPWILGGDIVTRVQGHAIRTPQDFVNALRAVEVGNQIQLELFRNHGYVRIAIRLDERPVKSIVRTVPRHQDVTRPMSGRGAGASSYMITAF
jgi:S1-C subfamily serine protease